MKILRVFCISLAFFFVAILFFSRGSLAQSASEFSPFGAHIAWPYSAAKNIGIKWNRGIYFSWSIIDPNQTGDPSLFQWRGVAAGPDGKMHNFDYDAMLIEELQAGLQVVYNIDIQDNYMPGKFRQPGSWLPVNIVAYKNFVRETARRYPFVRYWQIGNEPDFLSNLDKTSYAVFHCITYESIKEGNPQAKVIMAGLMGNPTTSVIQQSYYDSIIPLFKGKYIDIYDMHIYGGASLSATYKDTKAIYNYYRFLLNKNGYYNVPIWITEGGTFSGTIKTGYGAGSTQTEAEQARDLIKRYIYSLSLGVEKIFWAYGLVEGFMIWDDDIFDHTGLIYGGQDGSYLFGERKLGYYTYQLLTSKLEGSDWKNIKTLVATNGIYLFRFIRAGRPVWVAWNDNASDRQVVIPGIVAPKIKITEMVPKYNSGRGVPTTGEIFNVTTQAANSGISIVLLKRNPVVIEETI